MNQAYVYCIVLLPQICIPAFLWLPVWQAGVFRKTKWVKSRFDDLLLFHLPPQPTLTLEKDGMVQERPSRPSRQPKKKQRVQAEPELSESDEYVDFTEPRHDVMAEFNTVIVGEETETSSAVQSIQQVDMKVITKVNVLLS